MDKKKCGLFFKKLREERNLTQAKMVEEFSNNMGVVISETSISKWERGESFPEIMNLKDLAKFFDVTLDELCNGEKFNRENFEEKYFICNRDWHVEYYQKDKNCDLWSMRHEQIIKIEKSFNYLLGKIVDNAITQTQEQEFDFLCENFFSIEDDLSVEDAKFKIRKNVALMHKSSFAEKMWEAYKLFDYKYKLGFFKDLCDNVIGDAAKVIAERIKASKDFEKDILLAFIQKNNLTYVHKDYFCKVYGIKYDEEMLTKKAIKLLIENGARLNKNLMGYYETRKRKDKIIDVLVGLYRNYKKPILVKKVGDNKNEYYSHQKNENSYYYIENNFANREVLKDEWRYYEMDNCFDENYYNELEKKLYNGETEYIVEDTRWVGIDDYDSEEWAGSWQEALEEDLKSLRSDINELGYKDYYKQREEENTKELLRDLEDLSLTQIREKYFTVEPKTYERIY